MGNRITALILSALLTIAAYATTPDTIPVSWHPGNEFSDTTVSIFRVDTLSRAGHELVHLIRTLKAMPELVKYRNLRLHYWDGEIRLGGSVIAVDNIEEIRPTFAGILHVDNPDLNISVSVHSDCDSILPRILVPDGTSLLTTGMTLEQQRAETKIDSIANNGEKVYYLRFGLTPEWETTEFIGKIDLENGWIMPLEIVMEGIWFFAIGPDKTVGSLWRLAYKDWGMNIPENYNQLFQEYFQTHGTKVKSRIWR